LRYVAPHFNGEKSLSIFEPSVGDGSFIKSFNHSPFPDSIKQFSLTAIDKILPELRKAKEVSKVKRKHYTRYTFLKSDFLQFQNGTSRKFSLIAGNPPYIKKGLLNKTQISLCQEIHSSAKLSPNTVKNIWTSFLVRSCQLLNENGVLAFVLPAELLQVKFSTELRNYLTSIFQRVEVFTFGDLLFECKGQDTVLLFGYKQHNQPGQFYTHIVNTDQLSNNDFVLTENHALVQTNTKWSHHLLSSDELTFIHAIGDQLHKINHYCDSKPGIVTAANSFFIVNAETERKYNLRRYTQPIIQKGMFVNGSVVFNKSDFNSLVTDGKPTKVLCFDDEDADELPARVHEYIKIGEEQGLPVRYKCSQRENWFVIPNISTVPEGFFFKRSHFYPKLLKNNADVLVTDSAYKIEMKKGYDINHLVYSFYNSLTLAFAELNGRYYGGGVLELTPSEFKGLPVPNVPISAKEFNSYTRLFENKTEILDILDFNDSYILNTSLNLSEEEIIKVKSICKKLIDKRFRK
jgi:adenine-specific DNA-methyltransferase